jgi:hypothetical protein
LVCYRREEKPREKVLRKNRLLAECYCAKLKVSRKKLIINKVLVEAAGVELFRVLITRNLLILGTATKAKKAPLPDPLYVYCTKILSCSYRPRAHHEPSIPHFAAMAKEELGLRLASAWPAAYVLTLPIHGSDDYRESICRNCRRRC